MTPVVEAAARAITLYQPWASLIFTGWKKFETRPRKTNVRGPLLIHAAACKPKHPDQCKWLTEQQQKDFDELLFEEFGCHWNYTLPTGAIIGQVELVDWYRTEEFDADAPEKLCGDWTPRRYAWRLEKPEKFATSIPAKGSQGFWYWRDMEALTAARLTRLKEMETPTP